MRQLVINKLEYTKRTPTLSEYLNDIDRYPLLSAADESKYAFLYRDTKDRKYFDILVNSNLRFVVSVSKQYQIEGMQLLDLIQYGNIGLIRAVELFDPTRGLKLISYAVWWIRQSIAAALSEDHMIPVPTNIGTAISLVNEFKRKFYITYERNPTFEEICEGLPKLTEPVIKRVLNHYSTVNSLQEPFFDLEFKQDNTLEDVLASDSYDEYIYNSEHSDILNNILKCLTDKEREFICRMYGINGYMKQSTSELAIRYNKSDQTIRDWEAKILKKCKQINNKLNN